jgi:hypothetical protein
VAAVRGETQDVGEHVTAVGADIDAVGVRRQHGSEDRAEVLVVTAILRRRGGLERALDLARAVAEAGGVDGAFEALVHRRQRS